MNKYQEAKSNIINTLTRQVGYKAYKNLYEKDLETLQELVDKATPKKVEKRLTNGEPIKIGNVTFRIAKVWYCPNCDNWISPSTSVNYCGHCGQKLDYWSEYDE